MNTLLLIPKRPYPPYEDGGTLIYYYLTKYINNLHILYFLESSHEKNENYTDYSDKHSIKKLSVNNNSLKKFYINGYMPRMNMLYSEDSIKEVKKYIVNNKIDTILCNYELIKYAEILKDETDCKIILHAIDAVSMSEKRLFGEASGLNKLKKALKYKMYFNIEKKYNLFHKIIVVSDVDKQYFIKEHGFNDDKVVVISNGVDTDFYEPKEKAVQNEINLGFSGIMDYAPNVEAVTYFLAEVFNNIIASKENIKYWIIGKNPATSIVNEANKYKDKVVVTGFVNDIRDYLNKLDIYVSTLKSGGGIKNKVLEALSMGVPVVASNVSVEGIEYQDEILVYENEEELISHIVKLLNNDEYRNELSTKSRALVINSYSWSSKIDEYKKYF